MSHAAYVLLAWGATLVVVGLYAAALKLRGWRLLRRVQSADGDDGP